MTQHAYTRAFSTRMKTDSDGCYTREVEGLPVEGSQKLEVLTREANARFGEGNWVLTHAYGDHHSDRTLLAAAEHPFAVTPDRPLRRTARNPELADFELALAHFYVLDCFAVLYLVCTTSASVVIAATLA